MTMDPLIGQVVLGRYSVERRIGAGGMGSVYVGKQATVGRQVALKILRTDLMSNEHVRERFRREAEIIGKLRHPNTIQLIDYGETDDGLAVMVMELLVGSPLNDRLKESGPLPLVDALTVGIEVAQSLAEAHLLGLVHRDLKPANIFLVEVAGQRHAKVLDFGIARILDEEATRLTSTGQVFGTPRYMSPEQALSTGEVDSRSDIYSLGLIIYECIVGQPPFVAQTSIQYLSAHSTQPPPKLRQHAPDAPESLETLIDACLAKEPIERPQTAEEVVQALSAIRRSIEAGSAEPLEIRRTASGTIVAGGGTGATKTVLSGTKTEIRPKGNTETALGGPPGPKTAIDDTKMLPPRQEAEGRRGPALLGAVAAVVIAASAAGAYLLFRGPDDVITSVALDATAEVRGARPDAAVAIIAHAAPHDAGALPVEVEVEVDAGTVAEEEVSDGGLVIAEGELDAGTKPTKHRGKGKTKVKDPEPAIVGSGKGVVTGPAAMVIATGEDETELVELARGCKASVLKGNAKLSVKGCGEGCAILVDEKCAGRTPASEVALGPGFHNVAVVCGASIELTTMKRFPADELTELRCR